MTRAAHLLVLLTAGVIAEPPAPGGGSIRAVPTPAQIESDWLRQATLRFPPADSGQMSPEDDARGGNDGVRDSGDVGYYGFHTNRDMNPWWQVDLGRRTSISRVMIYNGSTVADAKRAFGIAVLISGDGRKWVEGRRRRKPYCPGVLAVVHTFGSNLKWNPHIHLVLTAGGLSLDGQRWVPGPKKYLAPAPALATEWKLRLIAGIRGADCQQPLFRRRLRNDRRRRINLDLLLGHVRKQKWHVLIGPSLRTADKAVRYACRYTKRPVIAEGRIKRFKDGHVTFQFKDYHRG